MIAEPLEILENSESLLVISKPSSLQVHPGGRYYKNTVTYLLKKEYKFSEKEINRE